MKLKKNLLIKNYQKRFKFRHVLVHFFAAITRCFHFLRLFHTFLLLCVCVKCVAYNKLFSRYFSFSTFLTSIKT